MKTIWLLAVAFLAGAGGTVLVTQLAEDDVPAAVAAPIPPAAAPAVDWSPYRPIEEPRPAIIDPFKTAPAQPQFSQAEIDRVNAALQARNDSIDAAKAAGRAAAEAYADEMRRR